jgi:hypothetical protein
MAELRQRISKERDYDERKKLENLLTSMVRKRSGESCFIGSRIADGSISYSNRNSRPRKWKKNGRRSSESGARSRMNGSRKGRNHFS